MKRPKTKILPPGTPMPSGPGRFDTFGLEGLPPLPESVVLEARAQILEVVTGKKRGKKEVAVDKEKLIEDIADRIIDACLHKEEDYLRIAYQYVREAYEAGRRSANEGR